MGGAAPIWMVAGVHALGWGLVHSLWQGTLILVLFLVIAPSLNRRASARYAAACAALALMLAAPAATVCLVYRSTMQLLTEQPMLLAAIPETFSAVLLPWLVALWLAGVLVLAFRLLGGWMQVVQLQWRDIRPVGVEWQERVAALARRVGVGGLTRVLESARVDVPTVAGWLRPVLLLPASALIHLPPSQLEAVIAHELAHIRRHDYLVNFVQTVVETLLFYHPAAWWLSRQIRLEREHCCDDIAVQVAGSALLYARALTELEGLRGSRAPLALSGDGGHLKDRVHRLLGLSMPPVYRPPSWLALVVVFIVIAWMAGGAVLPWRQDRDPGRTSRAKLRSVALIRVPGVESRSDADSEAPAEESEPQATGSRMARQTPADLPEEKSTDGEAHPAREGIAWAEDDEDRDEETRDSEADAASVEAAEVTLAARSAVAVAQQQALARGLEEAAEGAVRASLAGIPIEAVVVAAAGMPEPESHPTQEGPRPGLDRPAKPGPEPARVLLRPQPTPPRPTPDKPAAAFPKRVPRESSSTSSKGLRLKQPAPDSIGLP